MNLSIATIYATLTATANVNTSMASATMTGANLSSASLVLGYFSVGSLLVSLVNIYVFVIFAWAILSWFNKGSGLVSDIYQALDKIVDPFVGIFRKLMPPVGGFDLSPLVAILVLQVAARLLAGVLI